MVNLCLLIKFKPFLEKKQSQLEIFNEISVAIHTFIYFLFKVTSEKSYFIGGIYVGIYFICILVNMVNLVVYKTYPEILKMFEKLKVELFNLKYELWKHKWLQRKKNDSLMNPSNKDLAFKYIESLKIKERMEVKKKTQS